MNFKKMKEHLEQLIYNERAVGTKEPGKIDYSLSEVFRLKAQPQTTPDDFFDSLLIKSKQFFLYGDTNHTDTDIHEFFFSDEHAERLVKNGVKHVVVEFQPEFQDIFDQCAEGKLNPDQFVEQLSKRAKKLNPDAKPIDNPIADRTRSAHKAMARAVRYWHLNGVKTHCPDDRSGFTKDELKTIRDNYEFMYKALRYAKDTGTDKPVVHQRLMLSFMFNSVSPDGRRPKNPATQKDLANMNDPSRMQKFMKKRMDDDKKLAKKIKALAGDEKTAVLFGAGHYNRKNGLGDLLGKNDVVHINIHSSMEMYAEKGDILTRRRQPDYKDPEYVHIIETNKVYKTKGLKKNS